MSKDLVVYGISHHKAPVSVRERLAATPEQASAELSALRDVGALGEGVLLSTCNREGRKRPSFSRPAIAWS